MERTDDASHRRLYSLDEDLAIVEMLSDDIDLSKISFITGRSKDSVNHRFKKAKHGICKIMHEATSSEDFFRRLYEFHRVNFPGDYIKDIEERISRYEALRREELDKAPPDS